MKDYSQNGEGVELEKLLKLYYGGPSLEYISKLSAATFLDIGAGDGVTHSNTYGLLQEGWAGCYVEPDPRCFARLAKVLKDHPKCALHRTALVTPEHLNHHGEYGRMMVSGSHLGLSTLKTWSFPDIPCSGLWVPLSDATLFFRGFRRRVPTVMSIDTEGFDAELVTVMLGEGVYPMILICEIDKPTWTSVVERKLSKAGYDEKFANSTNKIYGRG